MRLVIMIVSFMYINIMASEHLMNIYQLVGLSENQPAVVLSIWIVGVIYAVVYDFLHYKKKYQKELKKKIKE